jgi:hypothetical protein
MVLLLGQNFKYNMTDSFFDGGNESTRGKSHARRGSPTTFITGSRITPRPLENILSSDYHKLYRSKSSNMIKRTLHVFAA